MNSFRELSHNWVIIALAGSLLVWLIRVFLVRLWGRGAEAGTVRECPLCKKKPLKLVFSNRCSSCGCEYDKWGNILGQAKTPAQREELNRERLAALEDESRVRRSLAEWNEVGRTRFETTGNNPNPRSEHYQPGSSQEITP